MQYNKAMFHPILSRLLSYTLRFSLLLLALTASANAVFGTPATLKQALRDGKAYEAIANLAAGKARDAAASRSSQAAGSVTIQDIDASAKASVTAQSTARTVEKVIDNNYGWLQGKTAEPDLRLDLTPYVDSFSRQLGDKAAQRAQSLPACTAAQVRQLEPSSVDGFNLPCLPPGINPELVKQLEVSQLKRTSPFLENPVLTPDDLPKDGQGRSFPDRISGLPAVYGWIMRLPVIFGAIAIVCGLGLLLLLRGDWRTATGLMARGLIGVGITVAVLAGLTRLLSILLITPDGAVAKLISGDFGGVVIRCLSLLEKAYDMRLLLFAAAYVAAGIAAIFAVKIVDKISTGKPGARQAPYVNGPVPSGQ